MLTRFAYTYAMPTPACAAASGHASPATTSRYDRRGDKARRAAAERLHLEVTSPPDAGG